MTNTVGHNGFLESYNIAEAKSRLSEIVKRVSQGEEILLTRRGKPVVRLSPAAEKPLKSILGAGRNDPNINHAAAANDDWWKPMSDDEAKPWYE